MPCRAHWAGPELTAAGTARRATGLRDRARRVGDGAAGHAGHSPRWTHGTWSAKIRFETLKAENVTDLSRTE